MSIKKFEPELLRFLASTEPEVLCITGKWGVGKTFAWNHFLQIAKENKGIALQSYAYASLFGQNSLADVREAIFAATMPAELIGQKPDVSSVKSSIETAKGGWRSLAAIASHLPGVSDFNNALSKIGFLTVRDQLICVDDLERSGKDLPARDVLGMVSFLKEQRGCKVVVLLNDEELQGGNAQDFRSQLEKVADTVLRFEPSTAEAAAIGLNPKLQFYERLKSDCVKLGIVNLRVIKKIERLSLRLVEHLEGMDKRVIEQAVHAAALFGFIKFQPDAAPPMDYVVGFNRFSAVIMDENTIPAHVKWRDLISEYGWSHTDELDLVVRDGVQNGHFDSELLKLKAVDLEKSLKLSDKDRSFSEAWDKYHDSFDDNAEEILDELEAGLSRCAPAISALNLSNTITFLKEMGRGGGVANVIAQYIANRDDGAAFWDLSKSSFRHEIRDPDVIQAFKEKFASMAEAPDLATTLLKIGEQNGWNEGDIEHLSSCRPDEYYEVFKRLRGAKLRRAISGATKFRNVGNATTEMRAITAATEAALAKIAAESPLNARRVKSKLQD